MWRTWGWCFLQCLMIRGKLIGRGLFGPGSSGGYGGSPN